MGVQGLERYITTTHPTSCPRVSIAAEKYMKGTGRDCAVAVVDGGLVMYEDVSRREQLHAGQFKQLAESMVAFACRLQVLQLASPHVLSLLEKRVSEDNCAVEEPALPPSSCSTEALRPSACTACCSTRTTPTPPSASSSYPTRWPRASSWSPPKSPRCRWEAGDGAVEAKVGAACCGGAACDACTASTTASGVDAALQQAEKACEE